LEFWGVTRRHLVPLLHQTYQRREKIHSKFAYKLFTLLCIFLSTLILIVYPLQAALNDMENEFINNLFNSSGGGSMCAYVLDLDLYGDMMLCMDVMMLRMDVML
jgi:hypothetical protein